MPVRIPLHALPPLAVLLVLLASGCGSVINTLPTPALPDDPMQEIQLVLPAGLEILSVDFDAAMFADSSSIGGRGFVKVLARDLDTGEQLLLLYEDLLVRSEPIQVIRFYTP